MTEFAITTATDADWDDLNRVKEVAFHEERSDEVRAAKQLIIELDRTLVARRDGEAVGTAAILSRGMAVPGAVVPAAHVTQVAVLPTARRQGILTAFMRRQFADARGAGEPIAVLWASEGRIYQRYGYGVAAMKLFLDIETNEVELHPPSAGGATGRLRAGTPADLRDHLVRVYDQVAPQRPGWSQRASRHWDHRLADLRQWRHGATPLQAVLHEDADGDVDGYALWRVSGRWSETGPNGQVRVVELVSRTPQAYAALWRFLLGVDLTRRVQMRCAAADEPLVYAVSDPRRLDARLSDALWLRVLDVPAALSARRYATQVDVVLEVTDEMLPVNAGRWRLTGTPTAASCVPTTDPADLGLDVRTLGAAYLGGPSLATLAVTGAVTEHTPGALARADLALRWYTTPSAPEMF